MTTWTVVISLDAGRGMLLSEYEISSSQKLSKSWMSFGRAFPAGLQVTFRNWLLPSFLCLHVLWACYLINFREVIGSWILPS